MRHEVVVGPERARAVFGEEEAVVISYKKIPTDPKEVAKALGKEIGTDKIPEQMIDQYIGMFATEITQALNDDLAKHRKSSSTGPKRAPDQADDVTIVVLVT